MSVFWKLGGFLYQLVDIKGPTIYTTHNERISQEKFMCGGSGAKEDKNTRHRRVHLFKGPLLMMPKSISYQRQVPWSTSKCMDLISLSFSQSGAAQTSTCEQELQNM